MAIADVVGAPARYRLRLTGTQVNDYDGADYTGRFLDEVLAPEIRGVVLAQYDGCVAARKPLYCRYAGTDAAGRPGGLEKLFLPLSLGGESVDQIAVCIYAIGADGQGATRQTLQDFERNGSTLIVDPLDVARELEAERPGA